MTAIENKELKGITIKNIIVTVISTASIVVSVMGTYASLKEGIQDAQRKQETVNRVNEIRLKLVEEQVSLLQHQVEVLRAEKPTSPVQL